MRASLACLLLAGCSTGTPNATPEEFCLDADAHAIQGERELAALCADPGDVLTSEGCYDSPPPISYLSQDGLDAACADCAHGYACDLNAWWKVYPCAEDGEPDYDGDAVDFLVPACRGVSVM